jgi:hypothetical protein
VQDETVLLDLKQERYYGLDDVGSRVWELIGAGLAPAQLIEHLVREYDVDASRLRADLAALLDELVSAGLLEAAVDAPGSFD